MAVVVVGALSRLPHAAAGHRGEMPLPYPTCRRPPSTFHCGGPSLRCGVRAAGEVRTRGYLPLFGPFLALSCVTEFFAARDQSSAAGFVWPRLTHRLAAAPHRTHR